MSLDFTIVRDLQLDFADVLILEYAALGPDHTELPAFTEGLLRYCKSFLPDLNPEEVSARLQGLQQRGLVNQDLRCSSDIVLDVAALAAPSSRASSPALERRKRRSAPDPLQALHLLNLRSVNRIRYPETFLALDAGILAQVVGTLIPERLRKLEPLGPLSPLLEMLAPKLNARGRLIARECRLAQSGPSTISDGSDSVRASCYALLGDLAMAEKCSKEPCGSVLSEVLLMLVQLRLQKRTEPSDRLAELGPWIEWFWAMRNQGKIPRQPSWGKLKGCLELLFVGGVALWEEDSALYEELRPELRSAGLRAAEAGWGYVAQLFEQLAEDRPGPLRDFLPRTAGWRRRLDALLRAHNGEPDGGERVIWRLSETRGQWSAQPYAQKRTPGGWTSGRSFLAQGRPQWLGRQDARALDAFLERDAEKAWRNLVGHPQLFWEDQKVSLEPGEVRLRVSREKGRIVLHLDPPGVDQGFSLQQVSAERFELTVLPGHLHSVAEALGESGLSVPEDQERELMPLLNQLSESLSIASDVELSLEERELHRTLYLRLAPQGWGLRMDALIRPFGPDTNAYSAGEGPERLAVRLQGKTVQVLRDPDWEAAVLQGLGLAGAGPWDLPDPQSCLEFLDKVSACDPQEVQLEWPEGESFRLKQPSGKLKLSLSTKTDWFEISGGLELEAGQELHIQEILEMLRQGHGRFLALSGGEFVALSEEMVARLRSLTLLAEGPKLKLHPLAAGFLEDFPELEVDQAFQKRQFPAERFSLPKTFAGDLRGYQLEGYEWLCQRAQWGVGCCLADDMGLGKTIQTLGLLLHRADGGPALVVAPTSVVFNWLEEGLRFAPTLRFHDFRESRSLESLGSGDVLLCSYGLLVNEIKRFEEVEWQTLVLDEAQAIKNASSQRHQAVCRLRARARVATTGTPVENRLEELWALFRFLNPGLLSSEKRFRERFVEAGDSQARAVLRRLVHPFLLRRTKNQVLKELPPRTEITLEVPQSVEERVVYEALRRQAVSQLKVSKVDSIHVLTELTRLRRACCHPVLVSESFQGPGSKLQTLLALLRELKEGGHRALVFSQFVDHLTLVRQALEQGGFSYQYLDGSTPAAARRQQVEAFQSGRADVFLISLKAGGVGLNLTAADYVIHMDPWWNPAVEDQASDRAHRIGQLRPVTVYRLVAQNTVEDKIVALHSHKRELAQSLLEGSEKPTRLDTQEMLRLIREE